MPVTIIMIAIIMTTKMIMTITKITIVIITTLTATK